MPALAAASIVIGYGQRLLPLQYSAGRLIASLAVSFSTIIIIIIIDITTSSHDHNNHDVVAQWPSESMVTADTHSARGITVMNHESGAAAATSHTEQQECFTDSAAAD